jgi:hypothetical protein
MVTGEFEVANPEEPKFGDGYKSHGHRQPTAAPQSDDSNLTAQFHDQIVNGLGTLCRQILASTVVIRFVVAGQKPDDITAETLAALHRMANEMHERLPESADPVIEAQVMLEVLCEQIPKELNV